MQLAAAQHFDVLGACAAKHVCLAIALGNWVGLGGGKDDNQFFGSSGQFDEFDYDFLWTFKRSPSKHRSACSRDMQGSQGTIQP